LTADLSPQLSDASGAAFELFETLEMPSPTEENWRYVEVPQSLLAATIPEAPGDTLGDGPVQAALGEVAGSAQIVDGRVTSVVGDNLSTLSDLGAPIIPSITPPDRFAAAVDAFGGDGVVVRAAAGEAVAQPVYVSMVTAADGSLSIPRLFVDAAEASDIKVVVEQRSPDEVTALVLPSIEVAAGPAARVSVTVVQSWGAATTAIGSARYQAQRDAFVELAEAGFGAEFSRLHLNVDLLGRGADARIIGAYFGDVDQTLDYRYFMNHVGPNSTSEMFLKGAVAGAARSVFTGLIRIEPDGQGTNAHQTNRNLVLSDDAEAHSVPNLEILANDVRCGHGSTVGPLDEEQRYYLMSRGLPSPRADRLQVLGFFEDALQRFPVPEVEPVLRTVAMDKYDRVKG
jgi:Fe-S cluster assembly protein SufD